MRKNLGDQEFEVLEFILDRGPMSARDASEHFAAAGGLARTTVQTVLERLRTKGYLDRESVNGVFLYRTAIERDTLQQDLVSRFISKRLSGSISPFVAYLADARNLKADEIEQLRALVEGLEEKP